ncbi:lecithin retinol acyltransferase family protein [Megalobrama amblycephala]|uniref:lecithin retinol acyltransferase family protein n=1 Tax=Megalobrama amblycephala TaxID=75352 RepID=UPI002013F6D0|nr:lecithin retinol acyltransferase family protein [Megalobrama amblycephala]
MIALRLFNLFFITSTLEDECKEDRGMKTYDISLYKRGDLLVVSRTLFKHFGIYLGEGRIAHFIPDILPVFTKEKSIVAKMVTNKRLIFGVLAKAASVRVDSLADFAYGAQIQVNSTDSMVSVQPLNGEEVAQRAEKLIGSFSYSLLWHNCEHYVMFCRYGVAFSFQTFQFCKTVRTILLSRKMAFLSAIIGVFIILYLGAMTPFTTLPIVIIPFTIWMAS